MLLAVSLGGPETLVEHPATMSHGPSTSDGEQHSEPSIADGLIRLRYVTASLNSHSLISVLYHLSFHHNFDMTSQLTYTIMLLMQKLS